jgi:hypothetical protein
MKITSMSVMLIEKFVQHFISVRIYELSVRRAVEGTLFERIYCSL